MVAAETGAYKAIHPLVLAPIIALRHLPQIAVAGFGDAAKALLAAA